MDETLLSNDDAVVLPGVGAIAPGYVLVCPKEHVVSLAELRSIEGFCRLVEDAAAILHDEFGPIVMFEHGGCASDESKSQCVAHAHLHLWAIADRVELSVPGEPRQFGSLADFLADPGPWRGEPYLLAGTPGALAAAKDVGKPQFFRRQIAAALGRPLEWDYAAFWFDTNMKLTIDSVVNHRG